MTDKTLYRNDQQCLDALQPNLSLLRILLLLCVDDAKLIRSLISYTYSAKIKKTREKTRNERS